MASIIKDQLLEYLKLNNLISLQQHGFLSRHSRCTELLECLNDWILAVDNHQGFAAPVPSIASYTINLVNLLHTV